MTQWQPIETAPSDVVVKVGKWSLWNDREEWRVSEGIAWERTWFGGRRREYVGREYTHWQPMPPPPTDEPQ